MTRRRTAVAVPLCLAAYLLALHHGEPVWQSLAWVGAFVAFVLLLNLLVNPQLFRRERRER